MKSRARFSATTMLIALFAFLFLFLPQIRLETPGQVGGGPAIGVIHAYADSADTLHSPPNPWPLPDDPDDPHP
ncbi:MAG: hypothetical protein JW958_04695 [Candidatus Eisenbacteria bacterium]|nr:hypothetical protein [Candidatus Eisenbacteria bacterium]